MKRKTSRKALAKKELEKREAEFEIRWQNLTCTGAELQRHWDDVRAMALGHKKKSRAWKQFNRWFEEYGDCWKKVLTLPSIKWWSFKTKVKP